MRTMTRVFAGSALFAALACVGYAIVTGEAFGIVILGLWSVSLWVAAGWFIYHQAGDRTPAPSEVDDADAAATAGAPAGDFRLQSGWPVWVAFGAAGVAAGLVWSLWITLVGVIVLGYGLQRAVRD